MSRVLNPAILLVGGPVEKKQNRKQSFKATICKLNLTKLKLNKDPIFLCLK